MIRGLDLDDVIMGLDVAAVTGWAVIQGPSVNSGEVLFKPERRLPDFRRFVEDMVVEWQPALIVAEDIFINTNPSTKGLLHMHGVLLERMACCNSIFRYVSNARAKMLIGGNGKMTTKEKKQGAMVRALAEKGFHVDGTEAADALAVALVARFDIFGKIDP